PRGDGPGGFPGRHSLEGRGAGGAQVPARIGRDAPAAWAEGRQRAGCLIDSPARCRWRGAGAVLAGVAGATRMQPVGGDRCAGCRMASHARGAGGAEAEGYSPAGLTNRSVIRSLSPMARYLSASVASWRPTGNRVQTPFGWSL